MTDKKDWGPKGRPSIKYNVIAEGIEGGLYNIVFATDEDDAVEVAREWFHLDAHAEIIVEAIYNRGSGHMIQGVKPKNLAPLHPESS